MWALLQAWHCLFKGCFFDSSFPTIQSHVFVLYHGLESELLFFFYAFLFVIQAMFSFFHAGLPLNRARVLLERGPQLFKKTVPMSDRNYVTEEATQVLDPPKGYVRATEATVCKHGCKGMVQPYHRYCPTCRGENENYSSIADAVAKGGKSQGYKRKATPLQNMEEALSLSPAKKQAAEGVAKVWGDLVQTSRMRLTSKSPPEQTATPGTPALQTPASSNKDNVAPPNPATSAGADHADENIEYDLDCPESASNFLLLHWSEKNREDVKIFVERYIQKARSKITKSDPLSAIIQREVVKTGVLLKRDGRDKWLAAQKHARSIRFVAKPAFAK